MAPLPSRDLGARGRGETYVPTGRPQSFQEIAAACVADGTVAPWRLSRISEHIYTWGPPTSGARATYSVRCQFNEGGVSMPQGTPQGVTTASLLVVILVAAAVGAIVGGIIGTSLETAPLALASGFVATIVAIVVRNKLLNRLSGVGADDFKIPMVIGVFAIIASIAGSLASKEVLDQVGGEWSPVWIGTVAGLASAILMSFLMITYHMYPDTLRR
jgi:hypothetical protein